MNAKKTEDLQTLLDHLSRAISACRTIHTATVEIELLATPERPSEIFAWQELHHHLQCAMLHLLSISLGERTRRKAREAMRSRTPLEVVP